MKREKKVINIEYSQLSFFFFLFSLFISLLLSCKTTQLGQYEVPPKALPLDEGASLYIAAHAKEAAPIIKLIPINILQSNEVKMLMDRTDYLCAALFPQNSGKTMQLAAYGNYPAASVKMALGANKDWKKMKGGWYSDMKQISVYVTPKLAFASVWESDPETPVSSSTVNFPESFDSLDAPLSCWVDDPGKMISALYEKINVSFQFPIEKLFAAFYIEGEMFRVNVKLRFANASHARAINSIINMARFLSSDRSSGDDDLRLLFKLFFARAPEQNDNYVNINPPLLSEKDMTLLFKFLFASIY